MSGLTQVQQDLGKEVHYLLNTIDGLIDYMEFEFIYAQKLSKAEVEGAMQVRT